ncbi:MAG: NADH:flavin oxidoreductase [Thermoflexales bacterium]|nr:NADH:flavin oxidoreductase [Thermoflexales bacterium]
MRRDKFKIFSEGAIGALRLPNRLVRSSTWDPSILGIRRVTDPVLDLYRALALGGVGLIISGGLPVYRERFPGETSPDPRTYAELCVADIDRLAQVVHTSGPGKIVAQLEVGYVDAGPSEHRSPFASRPVRPLTAPEIRQIVGCFVEAIVHMKVAGFDGVQLHAAHGGLLSCFLSPYTNHRTDGYGGSAQNRVRMVSEIVGQAREQVGDWPILIKLNCTDYVKGGIELDTFPELAHAVASAGVDAVELSGGMWDCLVRPEQELGFRPVPAPESHTHLGSVRRQSYFLQYAKQLDLPVPVILVGGNRDIERLEEIVQQGRVDFIALCRPLIHEPDLPLRWLEGRGSRRAACISCNSCIYGLMVHPDEPEPGVVACLFKHDKRRYKLAQEWLSTWVEKNAVAPFLNGASLAKELL